jgi:guanylate kinase
MTHQEFLKILPELAANYRSAPAILQKLSSLNLLMIIGPSGVGKTSVINRLGLQYIPSETTRAPRPGEQEGLDFYFRRDYDQIASELKSGQFIQVAVDSGGELKATKASYYPDSGTVVMAIVTDVVPIMRRLGFKKTISAFITPPSYEEWIRRLRGHNFEQSQLGKRLAEAKRSLTFALNDKEMHFVLNDELDRAVLQAKALVGGQIDGPREQIARRAAQKILNGIN